MDSSASLRKVISQTQTKLGALLSKEFEELQKQLEEERKELLAKLQQEREQLYKEVESERRNLQNSQTLKQNGQPPSYTPPTRSSVSERKEVQLILEGDRYLIKGSTISTTFEKGSKEIVFLLEYAKTGIWIPDEGTIALGAFCREIEQNGVCIVMKPSFPSKTATEEPKLSIKDKISRFQAPPPQTTQILPRPKGSSKVVVSSTSTPSTPKKEESKIDKTPPPQTHHAHPNHSHESITQHSTASGFVDKKPTPSPPPPVQEATEKSTTSAPSRYTNFHDNTPTPPTNEPKFRVVYGAVSEQGERPYNEDRYSAYEQLPGDISSSFFGVFDGHGGINGSVLCKGRLHKNIVSQTHYATDKKRAIVDGFIQTDRDYMEKFADGEDGSTAIAALITEEGKLYVANVGDCRCVLAEDGKAVALSKDHKANDKPEMTRIEKAGHTVEADVEYVDGERFETYRVDGELAVSRAIGDLGFKDLNLPPEEQAVTCIPDIVERNLKKGNFIVLACDGLWDVLNNQEVVDFVIEKKKQNMPLTQIAEELVQEALEIGSQDNITVIIVEIL
jgi:protein phosphatase 2C family protein 2/3